MICNMDCFDCVHPDCVNDEISFCEIKMSIRFDKKIIAGRQLSPDPRVCWAQLNPERNKKNKQDYYEKNKDAIRIKNAEYYTTHKNEILKQQKVHYQENKQYVNQRNKEAKRRRYASNPEYYRQKQREYRARRKLEQRANLCLMKN